MVIAFLCRSASVGDDSRAAEMIRGDVARASRARRRQRLVIEDLGQLVVQVRSQRRPILTSRVRHTFAAYPRALSASA